MTTFEMYFYAMFFAVGLLSSAWWLYTQLWDLSIRIAKRMHGPDVLSKPFDEDKEAS